MKIKVNKIVRKKKTKTPNIGSLILNMILDDNIRSSYMGDIEEVYLDKLDSDGRITADIWYWIKVLEALQSFVKSILIKSIDMFNNYLKIAIRNAVRRKLYSIINITGLGFGIATAVLIMFWVQYELSFDKFHDNYENIYRVVENWQNSDGSFRPVPTTPYLLGPSLKREYPEVIRSVHLSRSGRYLVHRGQDRFYESGFYFADSAFFELFSFPLIRGNPETVLDDLNSLVITESAVEKYFGDEDPIGKRLIVNNRLMFNVSGIAKDTPGNSHMKFDFIANYGLFLKRGASQRWVDHNHFTYIELKPETDHEALQTKIKNYLIDNNHSTNVTIMLQALSKIHLKSNFAGDINGPSEDTEIYVYIFSVVAVIVLLIACINFMNLSTAQATLRSREIGIRKVSGARKNQIIRQFLGESFFISILALGFAFMIITLFLKEFNSITEIGLSISHFKDPNILIGIVLITLFTGVTSGSYPSLFLSTIQPVKTLKGTLHLGIKDGFFRQILVTAQFTLSLVLMIGMFVVNDQLSYMQNKDIGLKKENIIYFKMRGGLSKRYAALKSELLKHSNIINVAASSAAPVNLNWGTTGVDWEGKDEDFKVSWKQISVDYDYLSTLNLEVIKGRGFSRDIITDSASAYIVNETGAVLIGIENAIDRRFSVWDIEGRIIGIVKDFHFKSLHDKIEPLLMRVNRQWLTFTTVFVEVNTENSTAALSHIKDTYDSFKTGYPLDYKFLEEQVASLYSGEERFCRVSRYLSLLAVFISCLGLFGLTSFMTEQRFKEIGIRKVLGSSRAGLIKLLFKDIIKWILIANIIAWPIGWMSMNRWLQDFAYRTTIDIDTFVLAGIIGLIVATVTVSSRTIQAVRSNPVDSIRCE